MATTPLDAPLDGARIQRIYDRIGARYDLLRFAEAAPKRWALATLAVCPGERVLEVGVGTGAVLVELARAARGEDATHAAGHVDGLDYAPGMVALATQRLRAAGLDATATVRAGDARALPYPDGSFDAAFTSYVLDLLPTADIPLALAELHRVLRPGGRVAVVALAPGSGPAARLFTAAYEALYRRRPELLAGCRPLALTPFVRAAGFVVRAQRQWFRGHPSEALLVERA